jgi:hypothetical protein
MLPNLPGTNRRGTIQLAPQEFRPYVSPSTKNAELPDPDSTPAPQITTAQPRKSRFEGLASAYDALSWIFGFKEKYSLALRACKPMREKLNWLASDILPKLFTVFVCGGALIGFCLARSMMMSLANVRHLMPAGQCCPQACVLKQ